MQHLASTRNGSVFTVRDLKIDFPGRVGRTRIIDGVTFSLADGEVLGIVGESGSGKSVTVLGCLGLLPEPDAVVRGSVELLGTEFLRLKGRKRRKILGGMVGVVFQDQSESLNPVRTVGWQIDEAMLLHQSSLSRSAVRDRTVKLLAHVHVDRPEEVYYAYPHELSGGLRQRVMFAIAMANDPVMLVADEPTTALDVTVQAQVLDLLKESIRKRRMTAVVISHDLGVVAEVADRVMVMYAGRVVEVGPVEALFDSPQHPYTQALLDARLSETPGTTLPRTLPGVPATPEARPAGCAFHPRCPVAFDECERVVPPLITLGGGPAHAAACHLVLREDDRGGL